MIAPYSVINSIMDELCQKRDDSPNSPTWITDAPAVLGLGEDASDLAPIRAAQRTLLQEIVKYEIQKANDIAPDNLTIIKEVNELSRAYADALRKNGTVNNLNKRAQGLANNDANGMENISMKTKADLMMRRRSWIMMYD